MQAAAIWNDFHKDLKKFIYGKTKDMDISEDILQEVFVRIISCISKDGLNDMGDNLRGYIYGITRNVISEYFKTNKLQIPYEEGSIYDEYAKEEDSLSSWIADSCLAAFIHNLPESYREALTLSEIQGLDQKSLASRLGISYSWAKSRVQRGKIHLKNLISECCSHEVDAYGNFIPGTEMQKNDCAKCP